MVADEHAIERSQIALSVLALSSRFDGLEADRLVAEVNFGFQYSLCRVVLMVAGDTATH